MEKNERGRSAQGTALSSQARTLARILADLGMGIPHTKALETVSRLAGHKNRHVALTATAQATSQEPPAAGNDGYREKLRELLEAANEYAEMGRDFPTFGVGSLIDRLESLGTPPDTATRTTPMPTTTANARATLRDDGDFALVRLASCTLKVTRHADRVHAVLFDESGYVVTDTEEDCNAEDEACLDAFASFASFAYGDAWSRFVPTRESHEGCDMIELSPGPDGIAVVEAFGLIQVRAKLTERRTREGMIRVIVTATLTAEAMDRITAERGHDHPPTETMIDVEVQPTRRDVDAERLEQATHEFEAYLLPERWMEATGDWERNGDAWTRPVRIDTIPSSVRPPAEATFTVWFAGPRSDNVTTSAAMFGGMAVGRRPQHPDYSTRRQRIAMDDAMSLVTEEMGRRLRATRWDTDASTMTATVELSTRSGTKYATIKSEFGINTHPRTTVRIDGRTLVREPHNDAPKKSKNQEPKQARNHLDERRRELTDTRNLVANMEFADYEFGEDERVAETSGWEYDATEMRRKLFIEAEDDEPTLPATMTVTFAGPGSSTVTSVTATFDGSGTRIGSRRRSYDLATRRTTLASLATAFQLPERFEISHDADWRPTGDWSDGRETFETTAQATIDGEPETAMTIAAVYVHGEEAPWLLTIATEGDGATRHQHPVDEIALRKAERSNVSYCDECEQPTDDIVGCPDGREVCRTCFDGGIG